MKERKMKMRKAKALKVDIPPMVLSKLKRMKSLYEKAITDELLLKTAPEYQRLQAELVKVFMPMIAKLCAARLVTIDVNIKNVRDIRKYSAVSAEPTEIFENGNIWLYGTKSGGLYRKRSSRRS